MKKQIQVIVILSVLCASTLSAFQMPLKGIIGYSGRLEKTKEWMRQVVEILEPSHGFASSWKECYIQLETDRDESIGCFKNKQESCLLEVYKHVEYAIPRDEYEKSLAVFSKMPKFWINIIKESNEEIVYEFGGLDKGVRHHFVIKDVGIQRGNVYSIMYHKVGGWFTPEEVEKKITKLNSLELFPKEAKNG